MRVQVKKEDCIGCGLCIDTCGEIFSWDNGKSKAISQEIPAQHEECAKLALESCPAEAIFEL